MKKVILPLCILTLGMASQVFAADGNVNFTGNIIASGCTVNGDSGTTINVPMGTYASSSLATAGAVTTPQNFNIKLTSCPSNAVKVRFDGTAVSGQPTLLALTTGQATTGYLGIQITDLNSNVNYNISGQTDAVAFQTPSSGSLSIPLAARYYAVKAGVPAGTANATTAFNLEYK